MKTMVNTVPVVLFFRIWNCKIQVIYLYMKIVTFLLGSIYSQNIINLIIDILYCNMNMYIVFLGNTKVHKPILS